MAAYIFQRPQPADAEDVNVFMERARCGPIVHRGGKPENTLKAIRNAKKQGAVGVEIDVMLTRDEQCVLLHDETVDRTSNGTGKVRDMSLEELKRLSFVGGESIATLDEAISLCEELEMIIFLDVKPFTTKTDLQKLLDIFKDRPERYQRICILSFYITALHKLRCMDSKVQCGLTLYCNSLMETVDGYVRRALWADALSPLVDCVLFRALDRVLLDFVGVKLLLFCKDDIIRGRLSVEKWSRKGRNVIAWTVNKRTEQQYFIERNIPYMSDDALQAVNDMPEESWIPPQRRLTLTNIARATPWKLIAFPVVASVVITLVYVHAYS